MASFREYVPDILLLSAGVFVGNGFTVGVIALLGGDLPRFLALPRVIPSTGPPLVTALLMHLIATVLLTVLPTLGVTVILYLDYRSTRR